jgi:hypothetical protein
VNLTPEYLQPTAKPTKGTTTPASLGRSLIVRHFFRSSEPRQPPPLTSEPAIADPRKSHLRLAENDPPPHHPQHRSHRGPITAN